MIQTISPNDDLVLDVVLTDKSGNVIEESLIANLQFVVYTEQTSELQRVYLSKTRYDEGKLHINSSELATLTSGQLYLTTAIALLNSQYNDGSFDYIKTSALPYYLRNSAMSVSDDEAILKWKIDVTKALQNIDESLKNLSTRLYTIEGLSGSAEALEQAMSEVLSQYATIQYVDDQDASLAANIQPEVDLTPYATTEDVSAAIRAIPQPDLTPYALKTAIPSLEGYATEQYVDEHDASVANAIPSVAGLATETYVTEQVGNIDLTPYATTEDVSTALADKADKNEIPSLDGYATEAYVDASINAIPAVDLTPYATTEDVSVALASKANTTDLPDLTPYATTADVSVALADKADKNEIPSLDGYATETFVTEHDASVAAQIPSLDGYATEQYVGESINAIPEVDLTPYATSEDVSTALAAKANVSDLDNYVTDASLSETLEDYITDASVAEGYISNSQMENVELTVATAVNRLTERVENIETTLSDDGSDGSTDSSTGDSSIGDSSTGDSSTGNSSTYAMTIDVAPDAMTAAHYTLTDTVPTEFTVTLPVYDGMPTTWDNMLFDWGMMKTAYVEDGETYYSGGTDDAVATTNSTNDGFEITFSNLSSGTGYRYDMSFTYNMEPYPIKVFFTTAGTTA